MENLAPKLTLTSSPLPVDGEIKGTIATEYVFTPTITHPEKADPNYVEHYMPSDYTFGYFTWIVRKPDGSIFDEGEARNPDEPIKLEKLGISGNFTIEIKVCDASGKWSDLIVYNIKVIFATNYDATITKSTFTVGSQPKIPYDTSSNCNALKAAGGGCVQISGDDTYYSSGRSGTIENKFVDMGFNFLAYGISFRYIDFSTNGLLTFAAGYDESSDPSHSNLTHYSTCVSTFSNSAITSVPKYTLSAYWDDLYFGNSANRLQYWADEANQRIIIEYKNLGHYSGSHGGTSFNMTIVISAAGYIDIYYISPTHTGYSGGNNGGSATIGIKGPDNNKTSSYSYNLSNAVTAGTKLTFTPIE